MSSVWAPWHGPPVNKHSRKGHEGSVPGLPGGLYRVKADLRKELGKGVTLVLSPYR